MSSVTPCARSVPVALNGQRHPAGCTRLAGHDGMHEHNCEAAVIRWPVDDPGLRGLEASDGRNTMTVEPDGTYRMTHHGDDDGPSVESMTLDVLPEEDGRHE